MKTEINYECDLKEVKRLAEELHAMCIGGVDIWADIQTKENELHEAIRNLDGLRITVSL